MNSERKELPDGWQWVMLGDVCKEDRKTIKATDSLAKKLPYLSLEHIQSQTGTILWNPNDIHEHSGKSNTFFFDDRHILYGKLRPYLNKVAMPNFAGRCTTELIPIVPTHVTRDYLVWILRRPESVSYAMQGRTGSRMPRTNMKEFMGMDIPLPPLEEQKRITAILDDRMAMVEKARRAAEEMMDAVDSLKNAILRELLPYLGQQLAEGWKWVKLKDVCKEDRYTIKPNDDLRMKLPYLSLEHIQSQTGTILLNLTDTHEESGKSNTFFFDDRHILYGKLRPYLNKVAMPNFVGRCTTELIPIVPTHITRDYLVWILRRPESVAYAMQGKTGSRMPRTNMKEFMGMDIPMPSLEEQRRIANLIEQRMAAQERAKAAALEQLEAVEAMRPALLRQAFSGAI